MEFDFGVDTKRKLREYLSNRGENFTIRCIKKEVH